MLLSNSTERCIVGLGEVLWDVFPDGPRFGGAPANFACSVAELADGNLDVFMVGAVGPDELGRRAVDSLREHGVDTRHVATVSEPTGQVLVKFDAAGHPSYEIATDTAWDNIPWSDDLRQLAGRTDAVCFGTLAQRSQRSRETIQDFARATRPECLRVLDINLRPPFWNETVVIESLELANALKLNDEELPALADILGWKGTNESILQKLMTTFSLDLVALTRGEAGAFLVTKSGERSDLPGQPTAVADTVGAGDAYTAALVVGRLNNLPLNAINAWANKVASFVCSQPGGTPQFPPHLRK
ncbi:MAG TPA: carbohydrate kinase [Lacipirellulaceae bacterium]|nr:carbohydrate kinase [Lacipirellulaceae bacterium]